MASGSRGETVGGGWQPATWRSSAAAGWTLAVEGAPRRGGRGLHLALAALCWPFGILMALAIRRTAYLRDDGRLVARLGRRADVSMGRRFARVFIPLLVAQVAVRVVHRLVGDVVLVVGACILGYVVLAGVVHLLRRAEVRPRAERHGFVRTPAEEVGVWVLEEAHHRGGFDEQSLRALRDLIEARVPAGETLYAAPMSQQYEDQLRSIGFTTAPGPRGRVQFERASVGGSTGHVRHDRALNRPQEESP